MISFDAFMSIHEQQKKKDGLRVGQRFVNAYIKEHWPDLFYSKDSEAIFIIYEWLNDNQYFDELPPVLNPVAIIGEKQ